MNSEVRDFLLKARDSLRGVRVLQAEGLCGFAVSRAYYAMFYGAEAERIKGDHDPVDTVTQAAADQHIARAEEFLETAERLLGPAPEDEPSGAL
jgi:uncharacterized protein (UPF0332 family)